MKQLGELFQAADWKTEKHVPVIECVDKVKAGDLFAVKVYFHPDGEKFPCQIGHFEFAAHGESVEGPDKSSVYTHHEVSLSMKTGKPGVIYASALCNIHGLWQSSKQVRIS
jgi:superoxide reductase